MGWNRSADGWTGDNPSGFARSYDGITLFFLIWPATAGMWMMGSTRAWGYAPGLFLSFLGSGLAFARPWLVPGTPRWRFPSGFWAFAVLTAFVVLGSPWASVPYAARWEALRWGSLLAAAWVWIQVGALGHRWKWLLGVLLLSAALGSLYAMVQQVNGSNQVLWMPRPEQYGSRASGPYLCPNHFANLLAMLFPLAVALLFLPEAGMPLRLMSFYFLAVSSPVLYWTQSRSGWLGAAGGLCATGLVLALRRSRRAFFAALVALPLLAAAVGWMAWKTLPAVRERMGVVLEDPEEAGSIRIAQWRDAPAMFRDRPVFGFGGGSYVWAYPPYQRHVRLHLTWDFAHNEFVQMALEYGAVGLGLLLVALLWAGAAACQAVVQARSAEAAWLLAGGLGALAASLIHALFDFNFHIFPNPHALVWIGGVAWGVWFARERGVEPPGARRKGIRRGVAAALAAACGWGAWLALSGGVSYAWNLKGEIARQQMEWEAAELDYVRAIRWDGGNAQPHVGLGHLQSTKAMWWMDPDPAAEREEKIRLANEAIAHYRRALELNPLDMAAVLGLARAHNAIGDAEAALEQYRRAASFQRRHVFYREQLGIQLRRMGRDDEALEIFRNNLEEGIATDVSRMNVRALERKRAAAAKAVPAAAP